MDIMKKMIIDIQRNKVTLIALGIILAVGIFLRTYHFRDWLLFGDDQIRDAYITNDVISGKSPLPLVGPFMSYSGDGEHSEAESFHMGPIYYYFQIISAKLFGNYPDKLAYPDVFFSILSIPLLFLFFRIYFNKNISLGITGLYAISDYFISYSRFAWNTNLIPFFVLLFLLSLYKFLEKNEKTNYIWILFLGISLGIGFQLHAIVMILFSVVTFSVFLFSMKKNFRAWKKWAVVLLIFMFLNASQIISEVKTNFSNSKSLLHSVRNNSSGTPSINSISFSRLGNDLDCHAEANFFLLTSYGSGRCVHDFISAKPDTWKSHYFQNFVGGAEFAILLTSLIFSISGYLFLVYLAKSEKDQTKKHFLQLIVLYCVVGFLIMLPLSKNDINELRYFVFGFFVPFLFLGFLLKFISAKIRKLMLLIPVMIILFGLLIYSNVQAINSEAGPFRDSRVTCSNLYKVTLGELENAVQYIVSYSDGQKKIYLDKDSSHRVMSDALVYLLARRGIEAVKLKEDVSSDSVEDGQRFYLSCKMPGAFPRGTTLRFDEDYSDQRVGEFYIFHLNTTRDLK